MKRPILALAALCAVLLAAGTYLVLSRWHPGNVRSGATPDLINLLPGDSPVDLYMDAVALRTAPFAALSTSLAPESSQDPEYARFVQQTGFDYTRDLQRLAGAIWPSTSPPRALVIAEGQFDAQKIRAYALNSGKIMQIAGKEVLLVSLHNPEKEIAITFLTPNRLALADGVPLDSLLSGTAAMPADPEFTDRVRSVAGNPLFAVARADALPRGSSHPSGIEGQLNALLSGVKYLSLAVHSEGEVIELTMDARTDSVASALRLSTTLEGLRFMGSSALTDRRARARLTPPTAALLDSILRTAEISHGSKDATVRLPLTPELLHTFSDFVAIH